MRKLAWTALGFTVAVGLAEYVLPSGGLPYIAAALAVLSALVLLARSRWRMRAAICLLAAAAGTLLWWGEYVLHVRPVRELVGNDITITAVVGDYVEKYDDYERVRVRVRSGAPTETALLYSYDGPLPALEPGDVIQAEIRLSDPMIRRGQRSRLYTGQGVFLLGTVREDTLTVTGRAAYALLRYLPQRLCRRVQELCDGLFAPDAAPFLKGLLTGDTDALEQDVENYTAMRLAGVLHIVAVSGMHLFVLTGFLQLLLGRSRRTSLVCLPVLWLFTLMAGCRPGVVRAAVMQTLVLLAPILRRETDEVTCLGAALLLLLVRNPMAAGAVGLQLSFSCMAGFVLLLPGLTRWMETHLPMERWYVRPLAVNLACTLSATVFSAPVAAIYFREMPLWSALANLLTLPVAEAAFGAGYAVCFLGALWSRAGRALGWILDWAVRWCMLVYRTVAALPVASLAMDTARAAVWLAAVYGLFALWLFLRRRKKRLPLDIPVCAAVIGLGLVLLAGEFAVGPGLLTALDVGQGACVVLAGPSGTVLVDCGGSGLDNAGDKAARYLQSIGRDSVDALVLTHLHEDHAGGVETLLYRLPVGQIILPAAAEDGDGVLEDILTAAARRHVPVTYLHEQSRLRVGDVELELLLPEGGEENERGIVALGSLAGKRALIMGDAGQEAERSLLAEGALGPADILVVGHHGSATATGALLLAAVRPETAVISVGWNTYGQPAEETLERLESRCVTVRRTDAEGDVTVRLGGEYGETG